MTMPASAKEMFRSRERSRDYNWKFNGKRLWSVDHADLAAAEVAGWGELWAVGDYTMRPRWCGVTPRHLSGGRGQVEVQYEGFDMQFFPQGQATVSYFSSKTSSQWREWTQVKVGNSVYSLVDEPAKGIPFVRIVKGPTGSPVASTMIALHTGIRRRDFGLTSVLKDCEGAINASVWQGFPAGTLMVIGVEVPQYFVVDDPDSVVPISYVLSYLAGGWNPTVQIFKKVTMTSKLEADWDATGTATLWYKENNTTTTDSAAAASVSAIVVAKIGSEISATEAGLKVVGTSAGAVPDATKAAALFTHLSGLISWMS